MNLVGKIRFLEADLARNDEEVAVIRDFYISNTTAKTNTGNRTTNTTWSNGSDVENDGYKSSHTVNSEAANANKSGS